MSEKTAVWDGVMGSSSMVQEAEEEESECFEEADLRLPRRLWTGF